MLVNFCAVIFYGVEFIITGNVIYLAQCIAFSFIVIMTWGEVIEWLRM